MSNYARNTFRIIRGIISLEALDPFDPRPFGEKRAAWYPLFAVRSGFLSLLI